MDLLGKPCYKRRDDYFQYRLLLLSKTKMTIIILAVVWRLELIVMPTLKLLFISRRVVMIARHWLPCYCAEFDDFVRTGSTFTSGPALPHTSPSLANNSTIARQHPAIAFTHSSLFKQTRSHPHNRAKRRKWHKLCFAVHLGWQVKLLSHIFTDWTRDFGRHPTTVNIPQR